MNDRMKGVYQQEINKLKTLRSKCRLDDYQGRAEYKVQIEELENLINDRPGIGSRSSEELYEERRKLEKTAFGNTFLLFPGRAAYAHAKIHQIYEELERRRLEEKRKQEIDSDIFQKSDFVKEGVKPAAPAKKVLNEKTVSELTEYTVRVFKELYRYASDYDMIKYYNGERVFPVIPYGNSSKEETYRTFEYFTNGGGVFRQFKAGEKYSEQDYDSMNFDKDYRKLIAANAGTRLLFPVSITLEELARKLVTSSINPEFGEITGQSGTSDFIRNFSKAYYTRGQGDAALPEMKELIKQYLLRNVQIGTGLDY